MAAPAPRDRRRRSSPRRLPARALLVPAGLGLLVFALVLIGYLVRFGPLLAADRLVVHALTPYAVPGSPWVHAQEAVSTLFGPTAFRIVAAIIGVIALLRRRLRTALFLLAGIGAGGLVVAVIKLMVDRPRPAEAVEQALGSSFPSGHALGVMVGVVSLALLLRPIAARRWRGVTVVVGLVLVIAVGFSRLALEVHHLSDVIAGYGLGAAWVLLAYAVTRPESDLGVRRPVDGQRTVVDPH